MAWEFYDKHEGVSILTAKNAAGETIFKIEGGAERANFEQAKSDAHFASLILPPERSEELDESESGPKL